MSDSLSVASWLVLPAYLLFLIQVVLYWIWSFLICWCLAIVATFLIIVESGQFVLVSTVSLAVFWSCFQQVVVHSFVSMLCSSVALCVKPINVLVWKYVATVHSYLLSKMYTYVYYACRFIHYWDYFHISSYT